MLHPNELPTWFIRVFAFLFGALWGSFANVVIYRWPRELSVVFPPSHCMACGKPVRPFDNVPILAWFWLRGRCRDCGARFSIRYPMVELIFAVISAAVAERVFFGAGTSAATVSVLQAFGLYAVRFTVAFVLLTASFIDLDEMIVPWFVKWFALVPLAGSLLLPTVEPGVSIVPALLGAGLGYVGLRLLFIDGYKLLTGHRGMGLGDPEILLVVGALLGVPGVLFALGAGSVQGVLATGIAWLLRGRIGPAHADDVEDLDPDEDEEEDAGEADETHEDDAHETEARLEAPPAPVRKKLKLPFVPFLALAALEYLLGADVWVDTYLRWMRGE